MPLSDDGNVKGRNKPKINLRFQPGYDLRHYIATNKNGDVERSQG